MIHKCFFDFMRIPTRRQIMSSYRLSANKHLADQPGENHFNVGMKFDLYGSENRQPIRRLMRKLKRTTP